MRDLEPGRFVPAVLLIVSPSLHGGGLFFDLRPWLVVGGTVVVLSALFWLPLVRGITRSLAATTHATGQIAEGRFDVRVPTHRRDELGQLGEAVNRMAQRLEGLVQGQKRFLGDIAHELCSPLARIQMSLGVLEQRLDPRHRAHLDELREEVEQMSGLVGELLSFSKASLGARAVTLEPVDLPSLVETAVRREGARGGEIRVTVPAGLRVQAAPELLQRALANVVRNAVRYASDAGPITISAATEAGGVVVRVQDLGPGVPEASLPRLFDLFYRVDEARTRETGGVGLGLTIVKTCLEACGGTVTCRNLQPRGFEVSLSLRPAVPTGINRE
jgi:two-component system sensor histidine kinase CpxA